MKERQEALRTALQRLGFDSVRFVRLEGHPKRSEQALQHWLAAGQQADMQWMDRSAEKRVEPDRVLPGARSAILLGVNYWPGARELRAPRWARYAMYEDYHDTFRPALVAAGKLLESEFQQGAADYRYYVDSGPVLERGWAERGGAGFVGKNAMLISPKFGNWLFLCELLTKIEFVADLPLAPERSEAREEARVGLYCGSCTQCLDACPTGAIRAPGVVDARLCISYQTIENKGIIPRELRPLIGTRIYGCDICLEVCPWNRFAQESRRVLLVARDELLELTLSDLLHLDAVRFAEVFRRTPIKRTKLGGILRNACIVAANTGAAECAGRMVELAAHENPVVRAHAVWGVFRLKAYPEAVGLLASAREREGDVSVLAEYKAEEALQLARAAVSPGKVPPSSG
jgi:epoxyqueuosine reductase